MAPHRSPALSAVPPARVYASFDSVIVSRSCLESDFGTVETGQPNARPHPRSHDRKPSVGVVISIPSRRSSSTYQLISHPSCISGLGTTDADFLVIPHHDRKFGARQPFSSSLFGKRKRQVPVLVKRPLGKNHLLSAMSASTSPC
jgi:hypothetical protein